MNVVNKILNNEKVNRHGVPVSKAKWFEIINKKTGQRLDLLTGKNKEDALKEFVSRNKNFHGVVTVYRVKWEK